MNKFLLLITLVTVISCKKNNTSTVRSGPLPRIKKITDSSAVTSRLETKEYFYNNAGSCDSIVFLSQLTSPPSGPVFRRARLRFEYITDSLPATAYIKINNLPEELYSLFMYNTAGKLVKQAIYTDTFKYYYDLSGRLSKDTQFNRFGHWDYSSTYIYTVSGNVEEQKTYSRLSPDSAVMRFSYDVAANPRQKIWESIPASAENISANNFIFSSVGGVNNMAYNYSYDSNNLPVKALLFSNGSTTAVTIRRFFYE